MNPEQVAALLAYASAIDPRIRRRDPQELQLQVRAWHAQLGAVDLDSARRAVDAHYAAGGVDAILPGDVRSGARGSDADRHPANRPLREAIAGPDGTLALPATPASRAAVEDAKRRLAETVAKVSADWAVPEATGYVPKRLRPHGPRTRPRPLPLADGKGRPLTVCFRCVADVPVPDGWDGTDPNGPPVYCGRCRNELARGEAS